MSDFTVFVTDSAFIDQSIYQLWLMGHSVEQTAAFRISNTFPAPPAQQPNPQPSSPFFSTLSNLSFYRPKSRTNSVTSLGPPFLSLDGKLKDKEVPTSRKEKDKENDIANISVPSSQRNSFINQNNSKEWIPSFENSQTSKVSRPSSKPPSSSHTPHSESPRLEHSPNRPSTPQNQPSLSLAHDSSVNGKSSLQTRINNAAGEKKPSSQIMKSYVLSHYRQFEMMEHFLHRPRSFVNSGFLFPMRLEAKKDLIEQYYSFDEIVMREFLGKKLNSRSRKDLDDICERTRILLPCCRRQFDNLKRIQKRVEDAEGELVEIIQKDFLLTRSLASQYAHINFININRLDTSKKKLSILSFADFEYCASVFMRFWTTSSAFAMEDVDPTIASDVREVKAIFLNSKDNMEEYRQLVSNNLPSDSVTTEKSLQTQFRTLVRNVLGIGAGLSQSKELRDIFINLVEKIVEPCIALEWTAADLESFFDIMVNQFSNLGCMNAQSKQQYQPSFARLLNGIKLASIRLYSRYHKT